MNFPVQREELNTLHFLIAEYFPAKDATQAQAVLSRLAAIAAIEAQGAPDCKVVDLGFRFDGEKQEHVPQLVIEFDPVPVNSPCDAKGWKDRDALAAMLASAQPAPQAKQCEWTNCPSRVGDKCCNEQASVVRQEPQHVAYLDIGVGGYVDLGSDLTTDELQGLPKGRHMLVIAGTFGIDGYVPANPAQQANPQPLSDEQLKQMLAAEYNRGWADCEATHDGP